jgi:hypothetical protein
MKMIDNGGTSETLEQQQNSQIKNGQIRQSDKTKEFRLMHLKISLF